VFFLISSIGFAAFSNPVMIDINNPKFRQLIVAIPPGDSSKTVDTVAQQFTRQSASELQRLLEFSAYFRIIKEEAYRELLQPAKSNPTPSAASEFAGWKTLGIDAMISNQVVKESDGSYSVDLSAIDILQGRMALHQKESFQSNNELLSHLKRFVDRLLEIYTGKPGIFASRIVFIGKRERSHEGQVFVCDIDGQNMQQLTHANKVPHLSPVWSRDGSKILYTSYSAGKPDLYLYEMSTQKVEKVAHRGNLNSGGVFAPNGKIIVYSESISGRTDLVYKPVAKNGGPSIRIPISQGMDVDPSLSPDGRFLTWVSGRFGNPHIFRVNTDYTANGDGLNVQSEMRLTYAGTQNTTPVWNPTSDKIAFSGFDATVGKFDILKMNPDGSNLERLTQLEGSNESPSWSPNGQHIVFHSSRSGVPQLFIMKKDGTEQQQIATGLYEAKTPDWGPQRK
jgi:TolB protein